MSQQYPGQPAGPGGGSPGPIGGPPGSGGPPGNHVPGPPYGNPPGYGGPAGYGGPVGGAPGPYGPPGMGPPGQAQPPKNNRVLLIAGLGCGLVLLLGIAAVVAGVFWLKSRGNAALEELQRLQASASAMAELPSAPAGSAAAGVVLTGDCLLAYRCCQAIATKSPTGTAAAQACEVFKTPAYPANICSSALVGYRAVAGQAGVKCD